MSEKERQVKRGIKVLTELDLCILKGLYEYRAFSTEQVQRRYGLTYWYTYKKLQLLRESGLISSHAINGYEEGSGNQGKYHRITTKGLMVLKEHGVNVDKRMQQLEVGEKQIPFLLATNDVMVDLEPYGWVLTDSREIKERLNVNRTDNIHGTLKNVHRGGSREYGVYTYLHGVSDKHIVKMLREIKNYSQVKENIPALQDYIIFKKGKRGFEQLITAIMNEEQGGLLARVSSIKLFPFTFGKYYLRVFDDERELLKFACETSELPLEFKRYLKQTEVSAKYSGLNCIVEHDGKEKYFVNLVDNDLKKVFNIQQYRKEDYETDGRKVLVYVIGGMREEIYESLFRNYHHVEYMEADEQMTSYLANIEPIEKRRGL